MGIQGIKEGVEHEFVNNATAEFVRINERLDQIDQRDTQEKERKKGGFRNFYLINNDAGIGKALDSLGKKNAMAVVLLLYMIRKADRKNQFVGTYNQIIEEMGISQATIQRCIGTLKKYNFIRAQKTDKGNIYTINQQFAWKSYGSNRKYCDFGNNPEDTIKIP